MKKVFDLVFSMKFTIILLSIFAFVMAIATFIEDTYDTITAKILIYNARWFEVLLIIMIINFIGNIKKHKLFSRKKAAIFTFHFAFIIMILGAGITRYFGYEGSMHIREGSSSNVMYSSQACLKVSITDKNGDITEEVPFYYNNVTANTFHLNIDTEDKGEILFDFNGYIPNAVQSIVENVEGGKNMIELSISDGKIIESLFIESGEVKKVGNINIAYNSDNSNAINISDNTGNLTIITSLELIGTNMSSEGIDTISMDTISIDTIVGLKANRLYNTQKGILFLYRKHYNQAKKQFVTGTTKSPDVLVVDVTIEDKKHTVFVTGGSGYLANYKEENLDGTKIKFAYGDTPIELSFSLHLRDFILDRYPGSNSPSSYVSEVTLVDEKNGINENHSIFMNNVLDYDGFRFFQSSYDGDEKGTLLSVNHDFVGTWVTYFSYFLLCVGFILTFFSKYSRFSTLRKNINKIRVKRKNTITTIALLLCFSGLVSAQNNTQKNISADHADVFGRLIMQTRDGRFAPVHTFAYDVMHKLSRKDNFNIKGKGKMDGMQVFIDMVFNSQFWQEQKIIYIREKSVRDILGLDGKYAAFNDFFDKNSKYRLSEFSEKAFRKQQSDRNRFDKEIIKVDERVSISHMIFNGSMLKMFPVQNSANNKWISWDDSLAYRPLLGGLQVLNDDLQLKQFNYNSIMIKYSEEVSKAIQTDDYTRANQILGFIESIQRQSNSKDIIPSETKIGIEIHYNKTKIFIILKNIYAFLSLMLLILAFIDNLKSKQNKIMKLALNFFVVLLGLAFLYHTYGMILRWYLTGHAPWSNGYEALLLVAWGGLLAGFSFIRYSKITLAATALLAFFMLMTASHSSYDPQLTNLQPVLKSYWLIIHVASITISYGFLGLGFMLGIFNLFIYLFKNERNAVKLNLIIEELTYINEMNLAIGIVLAVIGTFFGGVWANESWGRYWGWDAKETWALIIVITYAIILHLRFIPKLKGALIFNISAIIGFGSVIMTFIGVNYYLSKGMHSYAAGDTPIFPVWAWIIIIGLILLMIAAMIKENLMKKL